jgi:hypothetical protein
MVEEARAVIKLYKLDKESDFSSASVDDVIGWTGVAPTGQLGIGAGKRRSDLVRFISGITGSNVTLISRKITADLKQIVAKHSLVINNQSAEAGSAWPSQNWQGNSNNPRDYSYKKEWGVHAGISFGMDGTVTPSFNPSYTRNGVRTSAHISPDLFTGLKAMSSWLDNVLKPAMHISTVPNNEKLAQKLAALEQELPELYDSLTPADQMKAQQVIKAVKRVEADVMAAAQEPVDSKAMGIMYGKLKLLALKIEHYLHQYQTFADESPIKARVYLVSAMIGAKGIAGAIMGAISTAGVGVVPGFLAGIGKGVADEVRGGVTALAVGDLVANAIDSGLQKFAPLLIEIDPTLTHSQAILLGSILATTAFSAREFTNFARSFRPRLATGVPIPKSINVGKGSSASGTVWLKTQSSKYKPLTTSTKTDSFPANQAKLDNTVSPSKSKLWTVKRHDKAMYSDKYQAKYYRDPKTGLWWSQDNAKHGGKWKQDGKVIHDGSAWKVYKYGHDGLRWYKDADKYGQFIEGKHKSEVGEFIPWADLRGVHIKK